MSSNQNTSSQPLSNIIMFGGLDKVLKQKISSGLF